MIQWDRSRVHSPAVKEEVTVEAVLEGALTTSAAVLAEISLKSPRKIFVFIIKKFIYRIKVSKK